MNALSELLIEYNADVPTWFRIGGKADVLARPRTAEQVRDILLMFACHPVRVLGDGANLLVDDDGIDGVVIDMRSVNAVTFDERPELDRVHVRAAAGANLPKLITECVRRGFAGLETLAGIPATLGGAVVMNAGGAFGQIGDLVESVDALSRSGEHLTIPRHELHFSYRHSGLNHLFITGATLALRRVSDDERPALREKLKQVMEYKKNSQPLAENSAGCWWKNPRDPADPSKRISAGRIIDQCGLKGLTVGGATVSPVHANFVVTAAGCRARDVVELMERVRAAVASRTGIQLQPEVVYWRRSAAPAASPAPAPAPGLA
ncbi:MAG: UDP-N-acetylmuramate dehydrogenase [Planctomycetota bacterium]|nr:UDP-N-acetylmuramate dehydrogenase [Planctomycetota bacterium]